MAEPPYRPLDAQVIPRFAGIRTFMRAPHVTDLAGVDAAVYGIPFDTATSYRTGPAFGPEAIRSASSLLRPYNPALDVNVVDALSIVDYGDLPVSPGDTERTYAQIEEALAPIVDAGRLRRGARRRPLDHARRAARARARSTGRSRSCSSTRTATRGSSTSGRSSSTARRSSVRSRKGCSIAQRRCRRACAARSTAPQTSRTRAISASPCSRPTSCAISAPRVRRARAREGRREAGVRLLRHRLPRPGVRARHRHARGRRLLDGGGARVPARAARHQARRLRRRRGVAAVRRAGNA